MTTKEFLIIKLWNIRVNNYICSCALLFDNVHSFSLFDILLCYATYRLSSIYDLSLNK